MPQPIESSRKRESRIVTAWRECTSSRWGLTRVANAALTKLQNRLGSTHVLGMPATIAIEVTNICDGDCVLCPVGEGRRSRPLGRIEWDNFCQVIGEVAPYVRNAGLYNWGDPMIHPRIYDMIEYAKARRIRTAISSNLHQFQIADSERLVASRLDYLGVALHGLTEQTYRTYQPRHNLADTLDKVRSIVAAKERLGSPTPEIVLDFVLRRDNESERDQLADFARALGVGYLLEETSLNLRFLGSDRRMQPLGVDEDELRRQRLAVMDRWLPVDAGRVNPVYSYVRASGGRMPDAEDRIMSCAFPWYHMIVCWDGDVNLCCGSYEKKDSIGNVFRDGVRSVWNNPHYQAARRSLGGHRKPDDPAVLCHACPGMLL